MLISKHFTDRDIFYLKYGYVVNFFDIIYRLGRATVIETLLMQKTLKNIRKCDTVRCPSFM